MHRFSATGYMSWVIHRIQEMLISLRVHGCQVCFNPAGKENELSSVLFRRNYDDEIHALRVLRELQTEKDLFEQFVQQGGGHGRFIPARAPLQRQARGSIRRNRVEVFQKCLRLVDSVLQTLVFFLPSPVHAFQSP
jgi:hypothetical protein